MAHPLATREEHPLPAVIMHWVHLVSIIVLVVTGFYIHGPFVGGAMGIMRNVHFVFMFVLIFNTIVRVYWAFFGSGSAPTGSRVKRPDYKNFGYERENKEKWHGKSSVVGTLRYYLFLDKEAPEVVKYNGLQKATYVFWLLLIAAQAITGFAIWTPTMRFFLPLTYALGGEDYMRGYHYLIMWLFIVTTLIHIYLAVMHWDEFVMMFFWRDSRPGTAAQPAPADRTQ